MLGNVATLNVIGPMIFSRAVYYRERSVCVAHHPFRIRCLTLSNSFNSLSSLLSIGLFLCLLSISCIYLYNIMMTSNFLNFLIIFWNIIFLLKTCNSHPRLEVHTAAFLTSGALLLWRFLILPWRPSYFPSSSTGVHTHTYILLFKEIFSVKAVVKTEQT